jgi:galactokinase
MDQSASAAGGVIAFDGSTLAVERLSPSLDDLVFVVADSGVDRSLSTSSYATRVAESRQALDLARQALNVDIPHLAAVTEEQMVTLDRLQALPEPLSLRARHVVEETTRVKAGREAMVEGDWSRFGQLMTASGRSSATLYKISHPDGEELVADALQVDGVLGARMMGGGEGGTALVLLPRSAVPRLDASLKSGYYRRRAMENHEELIHVCAFAPGAAALDSSDFADLL